MKLDRDEQTKFGLTKIWSHSRRVLKLRSRELFPHQGLISYIDQARSVESLVAGLLHQEWNLLLSQLKDRAQVLDTLVPN